MLLCGVGFVWAWQVRREVYIQSYCGREDGSMFLDRKQLEAGAARRQFVSILRWRGEDDGDGVIGFVLVRAVLRLGEPVAAAAAVKVGRRCSSCSCRLRR